MNMRIEKLKEEHERNENKIAYLQVKNKKLAEKIRKLENDDIVGAVRNSGVTIDELLRLLGKIDAAPNTKTDLEEIDDEI